LRKIPAREFLPQAGRCCFYREPRLPGVSCGRGVVEGGEVPPIHYDPMLAKVIASGENRGHAIARLVAALRDYAILGVRTKHSFLIKVLEHPEFRGGDVDTGFLDERARRFVEERATCPLSPRGACANRRWREPGA